VDGLSVTESCWKRRRVYSCQRSGQGSDCTVPESCTLNRQECIRDVGESSTTPCRTWNYVYDCQRTITEDKQVEICSNQRFCIEGACFEQSRDESSDFGVAAAAAGTMAEIRDEVEKVVDPTTIQIFKGEARRCAKSGWGLVNCCPQDGGNLSGSLSVLCSPDERKLAEEVKAGKTHFIGAYCDKRILGSCVTRRHRYCSFGSKLGRIIHEQGRPQLPLGWGDASNPTCRGFSPAEFERLDFDTMNLDEFMQDVMARAVVADPTGVLQNMRNTATLFGAGGNNSSQDGTPYDQGTDPGGSINPPDTAPPTQGEVGPVSPGG
jgi:conjugal transfer mating pair stabilization protein TraN